MRMAVDFASANILDVDCELVARLPAPAALIGTTVFVQASNGLNAVTGLPFASNSIRSTVIS